MIIYFQNKKKNKLEMKIHKLFSKNKDFFFLIVNLQACLCLIVFLTVVDFIATFFFHCVSF